MSELDQKWAEAVINALPHLKVAHQGPKCTCAGLIVIEGVQYNSTDAACPFHGVRSMHIPKVGSMLSEPRRDSKRHTAHSAKE